MKQKALGIILYLSLAFGVTTVTYAASEYAQGGTWSHGVGSKYVWSYYYHGSKGHASTAIGKYESYSGYTKRGIKAKASARKAFWNSNRAYYKVY